MSKNYLFLGGPEDGAWRSARDPLHVVRKYPPLSFDSGFASVPAMQSVTDHHYTRRELTGGNCVYAHTSIPTHEILPRLLNGYSSKAL